MPSDPVLAADADGLLLADNSVSKIVNYGSSSSSRRNVNGHRVRPSAPIPGSLANPYNNTRLRGRVDEQSIIDCILVTQSDEVEGDGGGGDGEKEGEAIEQSSITRVLRRRPQPVKSSFGKLPAVGVSGKTLASHEQGHQQSVGTGDCIGDGVDAFPEKFKGADANEAPSIVTLAATTGSHHHRLPLPRGQTGAFTVVPRSPPVQRPRNSRFNRGTLESPAPAPSRNRHRSNATHLVSRSSRLRWRDAEVTFGSPPEYPVSAAAVEVVSNGGPALQHGQPLVSSSRTLCDVRIYDRNEDAASLNVPSSPSLPPRRGILKRRLDLVVSSSPKRYSSPKRLAGTAAASSESPWRKRLKPPPGMRRLEFSVPLTTTTLTNAEAVPNETGASAPSSSSQMQATSVIAASPSSSPSIGTQLLLQGIRMRNKAPVGVKHQPRAAIAAAAMRAGLSPVMASRTSTRAQRMLAASAAKYFN